MRIWDIPPEKLCRNHLLGEHCELHGLWSIITRDKKSFAHHPETIRWRGKLKALYLRHEKLVEEMLNRGYAHNTPLDTNLATGLAVQTDYVDTPEEQAAILRQRCDRCSV